MPKKPTPEQLSQWLSEILLNGVNLTVWEEEFIESLDAKRTRYTRSKYGLDWVPSDKEAALIERIYTQRVP